MQDEEVEEDEGVEEDLVPLVTSSPITPPRSANYLASHGFRRRNGRFEGVARAWTREDGCTWWGIWVDVSEPFTIPLVDNALLSISQSSGNHLAQIPVVYEN